MIRAGDYCRFIGFINYGLIIGTIIDESGKEIACSFTFENCFFTYTEGISANIPSHKNFMALEDCEMLVLEKEKLPAIFAINQKFETLFTQILTPGKEPAKIEIYKAGEKYYGKIVWLKYPEENGKPRVDTNNPDKTKRSQQIIGLIILRGFKFDGSSEWEDGKIYDPENGKNYSCYLSLKDKNTLKVGGYVGISWPGRTEIWIKTLL